MKKTMKATVSGFTCSNEPFTIDCEFEMIPPSRGGYSPAERKIYHDQN